MKGFKMTNMQYETFPGTETIGDYTHDWDQVEILVEDTENGPDPNTGEPIMVPVTVVKAGATWDITTGRYETNVPMEEWAGVVADQAHADGFWDALHRKARRVIVP